MRKGNRCFPAYRDNRDSSGLKRSERYLIADTIKHRRFCRAFYDKSSMGEECHGKLIRHYIIKLTINYIGTHYTVQFALHIGNSGEVNSNHRSLIRRSCKPTNLIEMPSFKKIGAVRCISHLDALAFVFSK